MAATFPATAMKLLFWYFMTSAMAGDEVLVSV
jgi:hypothetical protein